MVQDPTIKQVQLTGAAADEVQGGGSEDGKRRRQTRKKARKEFLIASKEGGGSTSPGTLTQLTASRAPGDSSSADAVGVDSKLTQVGAPVAKGGAVPPPPQAPAVLPNQEGGVKVVLKAAKKKTQKVVLTAAKKPAAAAAASHTSKKTRKAVRKIKMSMPALSRKITRAKTIRQEASKTGLEAVKKALHKAGLIKADSKAPEPILRQMYADYMMLKSRAL